ncbi:MAG: glucose-6-phosphate isomerase family protein [Bacillota bacterium]
MTSFTEPWARRVDFVTGVMSNPDRRTVRRLSDMAWAFRDKEAVRRELERGDPIVYEVFEALVPEVPGHLLACTTVLYSGQIGGEYYMTKGHYHVVRETAETYLTLSGEGILVLQREDGAAQTVPLRAGQLTYVPPLWAHRTVNTGDGPLIFFSVWPAHSGHDYATVERAGGFRRRVVARNGKPVVEAAE